MYEREIELGGCGGGGRGERGAVRGCDESDAGWCEAYRDSQSVLLVKDCSLLNRR